MRKMMNPESYFKGMISTRAFEAIDRSRGVDLGQGQSQGVLKNARAPPPWVSDVSVGFVWPSI